MKSHGLCIGLESSLVYITDDTYLLWGKGLVWLIGAVICLHAAPLVQLFAGSGNG